MSKSDKLKAYLKKRNLNKSPEPQPGKGKKSDKPIFVIQKHDASRLHYDFRLEVDGVLKSWAVPKGPSTDPEEKRLAIQTEDHPLEYAGFEGVIPDGEYGAGPVLIWDSGTYRNLKTEDGEENVSMAEALANGHATFWLEGEKLKGGYALIQTQKGKKDQWLLVKMDDDEADARRNPESTEQKSVVSGKTIQEIKEENS